MTGTVFDRLRDFLTAAGVSFRVTQHAPVFTSEEAAAIRGAPLCSGAKALVVKADETYLLLVLPADRKLDSKKARAHLAVKSLRFATREEVAQLTGLQPGSIPPFGSLFELPTYCDPALGENVHINFNAGDHSISISMSYTDYVLAEHPRLLDIT